MQVAQSWDDGVVDDLRLSNLLRGYAVPATFNLNPGLHQAQRSYSWSYGNKEVWRLGRAELTEVYAGFEIANHSMTHPYLPHLSANDLLREVRDSRCVLQDWFNQPITGFCYPFGDFNAEVQQVIRAAGHCYARSVQEVAQVLPALDPLQLGVSCHFNNPAFWHHYERVKTQNGLFLLWGHSYELLDEGMWAGLEQKIAAICGDPASTWVTLAALFN